MEYVDGEDLTSLRKRIGRFSLDKALEIGRQVCAGLAALVMATFVIVALRFGLLAFVVAATTANLWLGPPLASELSAFRAQPTWFVSGVIVASALYAASHVHRPRRPANT